MNSSSRLLRRLRTAKREDAVIIKAQEEKVKTILNPEKKPQYVKSLKSEEQQNTHILSQRTHTLTATRRLKARESSPTGSRRKQIL